MTAIAPILVWCAAGLIGLRLGGTGPAHGRVAIADHILAALLGPFSFLITFLAVNMLPEPGAEDGSASTYESDGQS